jgi:DNA-binding transcriptional ArsR family regulator
VPLLKELAEPLRLRVVDRLGHGGPATVSELAGELGVPLPVLSNHLKRLRDAGLVAVERSGRHAVYSLADDGLFALLPLLDRLTGRVAPDRTPEPDFAAGRTCYAHLAGKLGVAVYRALLEREALVSRPDGTVSVGPAGLGALGLDPDAIGGGDRRRFAFECFDTTQRAPHLAGALGDELAASLSARGWIEREDGSRIVHVTPAGRRGLERALGVAV